MRAGGRLTGLALAGMVVLSCFSDRPDALAPPGNGADCTIPGSAVGANRTVVLIRGFAFLQDTVRIRAGTTVTWVNCEPANVEAHTSTSDDGLWDSNQIASGEAYSRRFDAPGRFAYFCIPHPFMRGVVIVE